ncbi:MAG: hypothetical protein K8F91_08775 [Candidatus Obscuribacterales bacterium]|nr:hypothetical protein [Candidatus Obscuribacterales bacterium]
MSNQTTTNTCNSLSLEDALAIGHAACPDSPAEAELVAKEQMGTISDAERHELQRLRRCVC